MWKSRICLHTAQMIGVPGGQALPKHGGFIPKDSVDERGQNPGSNGMSPNPSMYQQHSGVEAAQVPVCWGAQMHWACSARAVSISPLMKKKMVSREDRQAYFVSTESTCRKLLQDCLYGKTYNCCTSNLTNRIKKIHTFCTQNDRWSTNK